VQHLPRPNSQGDEANGSAGAERANENEKQIEENGGPAVHDGDSGGFTKSSSLLPPNPNQFQDELSVFEDRPTLAERAAWRERKGKVLEYQIETNLDSLDGLPGLRVARREAGEVLWLGDAKARMKRVLAQREGIVAGVGMTLLLLLLVRLLGHATGIAAVRELVG
jgi:hypothetical protein